MIKTFIAMTTYGQIFFSKVFGEVDKETDISLTAGLISAVYQMTAETEGEKIEMLNLEKVRTHFKEDVEDKLFIISLDKAMDEGDSRELLNEIMVSFADKYGDVQVDGMILSDFEPVVDEIVENKLWYLHVPTRPSFKDIIPFLALLFSVYWYPMLLLDGEEWITMPILASLQKDVTTLAISLVVISSELLIPFILTYILVKKSNVKYLIRYMREFLSRPSRGGYSSMLPSWFLGIPVIVGVFALSVMRWGRGIYYSLSAQTVTKALESTVVDSSGNFVLWSYMNIFLIFDLLTWLTVFPLVVGLLTRNNNWLYFRSMLINTSISLVTFIPSFVFSGEIYQSAIGFHPDNAELYPVEARSLEFILQVSIPIIALLLIFAYYISIGSEPLIKRNKRIYKLGLPLGILLSLAFQQVIFWLMFLSGSLQIQLQS